MKKRREIKREVKREIKRRGKKLTKSSNDLFDVELRQCDGHNDFFVDESILEALWAVGGLDGV